MTQRRGGVVVMGVAGCGKSTVGEALALALGGAFVDGDSLHPSGNLAKMAGGVPLTDDDRWPWLAAVRRTLRDDPSVVVACSALARRYRDMLRSAGDVRFVHLRLDEAAATARVAGRGGHFMASTMVASQFAALETPDDDEVDVVEVDATLPVDEIVDTVVHELARLEVPRHRLLVDDGHVERVVTDDELCAHARTVVDHLLERSARRVLLVPPDHTRLHSRAGLITVRLRDELAAAGVVVRILPALGTHVPMTDETTRLLFGDTVAAAELLVHDWRDGLEHLGDISAEEVSELSGGRCSVAVPVEVDRHLFDGYDAVVSIGQVVPHEVIGMANFTKNVVIGLGGTPTIHRSHFLGAVVGMETIMGRSVSPVRDVVDAAFDRFIAPRVHVVWMLTVVQDTASGPRTRGVFSAAGGTAAAAGAAYRAAADLARAANVEVLERPLPRVCCWLDAAEFHSTWLGNKAVYRTRMAVADGGVLYVLAPGVRRFGEDEIIDRLIRRHGYRGTAATMASLESDPELAGNLSAAAHLVHGSSEARFRIVWCTDPAAGGLTRDEVESVGYEWLSLADAMSMLGVDASTVTGERTAADGAPLFHVANPALGLWSTAARFGA